jgi:hypothetical protein
MTSIQLDCFHKDRASDHPPNGGDMSKCGNIHKSFSSCTQNSRRKNNDELLDDKLLHVKKFPAPKLTNNAPSKVQRQLRYHSNIQTSPPLSAIYEATPSIYTDFIPPRNEREDKFQKILSGNDFTINESIEKQKRKIANQEGSSSSRLLRNCDHRLVHIVPLPPLPQEFAPPPQKSRTNTSQSAISSLTSPNATEDNNRKLRSPPPVYRIMTLKGVAMQKTSSLPTRTSPNRRVAESIEVRDAAKIKKKSACDLQNNNCQITEDNVVRAQENLQLPHHQKKEQRTSVHALIHRLGSPCLGINKTLLPDTYFPASCFEDLVNSTEAYAATLPSGWQSFKLYSLTQQDIAIRNIPNGWALTRRITGFVSSIVKKLYGQEAIYMDQNQPHVLKYDCDSYCHNEKRHTKNTTGAPLHFDLSHVTVNVMLSQSNAYAGGGTYFRDLNETVRLERGEMILHPGHLVHSGCNISSGTRYLLVYFIMFGPRPHVFPYSTNLEPRLYRH